MTMSVQRLVLCFSVVHAASFYNAWKPLQGYLAASNKEKPRWPLVSLGKGEVFIDNTDNNTNLNELSLEINPPDKISAQNINQDIRTEDSSTYTMTSHQPMDDSYLSAMLTPNVSNRWGAFVSSYQPVKLINNASKHDSLDILTTDSNHAMMSSPESPKNESEALIVSPQPMSSTESDSKYDWLKGSTTSNESSGNTSLDMYLAIMRPILSNTSAVNFSMVNYRPAMAPYWSQVDVLAGSSASPSPPPSSTNLPTSTSGWRPIVPKYPYKPWKPVAPLISTPTTTNIPPSPSTTPSPPTTVVESSSSSSVNISTTLPSTNTQITISSSSRSSVTTTVVSTSATTTSMGLPPMPSPITPPTDETIIPESQETSLLPPQTTPMTAIISSLTMNTTALPDVASTPDPTSSSDESSVPDVSSPLDMTSSSSVISERAAPVRPEFNTPNSISVQFLQKIPLHNNNCSRLFSIHRGGEMYFSFNLATNIEQPCELTFLAPPGEKIALQLTDISLAARNKGAVYDTSRDDDRIKRASEDTSADLETKESAENQEDCSKETISVFTQANGVLFMTDQYCGKEQSSSLLVTDTQSPLVSLTYDNTNPENEKANAQFNLHVFTYTQETMVTEDYRNQASTTSRYVSADRANT